MPEELKIETRIALEDNALESGLLDLGHFSPFTCPECHGALLQLRAGRFLRFRCHVGHAFSARSLLADLSESLDDALWNTLRALDESVMLMQHIAEHLQADQFLQLAALFTRQVQEAQQRSDILRKMVMQHPPTNPEIVPEDNGRVPIFPVRLRAELDVKWPYVSRGSTAPPCSTSARARWPRHWHDTRKCLALSSAG